MNVLVIGANGQIGQYLVELLKNSEEYIPVAMVRKDEQAKAFEEKGVKTVIADLEGTVSQLTEALAGNDAVVFTAGSGGHTGADKTLLVDLDGAAKAIEAAKEAKIDRFIMVSALQAHNRENWNEKIKHYYAAKHYADKILIDSGLNYTIVRPGGLRNESGTGLITAAENLERGPIPREDVAAAILSLIKAENTFKRGFDLTSGNTPIEEAINKI